MLDPFMNYSPHKPKKASEVVEEVQLAQFRGQAVKNSTSPNYLRQLFGNFLIRIGTKLTEKSQSTSSANRSA